MSEGFVYFMLTENGNFVKIGYARDPEKRRKEIQIGCPFRLYIVGIMEGDVLTETKLHRQFHRHRQVGEWFNYHEDISNFIREECPGPETVIIPIEDYNFIIAKIAEAEAQLSTAYYVAPDGTVCNQKGFLDIDRGRGELATLIAGLGQARKLLLAAVAPPTTTWWKRLLGK